MEQDADDCMDAVRCGVPIRRSGVPMHRGRATQGAVAENSYLASDAVTGMPDVRTL